MKRLDILLLLSIISLGAVAFAALTFTGPILNAPQDRGQPRLEASLTDVRRMGSYLWLWLSSDRFVEVREAICKTVTGGHEQVHAVFVPPQRGVFIRVLCPPIYGEVFEITVKGSVEQSLMLFVPKVSEEW
ncbi:MAG: hypothetical protein QW420_04720 [Candidatus Caldarchaeum sp.]